MGHCCADGPDEHMGVSGASQRDKVASAGEGGRVATQEDKVCKDPEAEESSTWEPCEISAHGVGNSSAGMEGGDVGTGPEPTWGPPYTNRTVGCFFPGCTVCGL